MTMSNQKSVFELYAHEYDLITNAAQREKYHAKEVSAMIERFGPTSVLDAGCASGLTTMLFARAGIETVGLDRSRKMIEVAKQKFAKSGYPMSFRCGRFEALPKNLHGKFDLIVCLANSISGVGSVPVLKKSLRGFHDVLRPGGSLVLQLLNYASIKEGELRPIRVTENQGIVYGRYSIRRGKKLAVHVIRLDMNSNPPGFEPFCHEFENFGPDQITKAAAASGFVSLRKYADLCLSRRFAKSSRDLVVIASRPKS